MEEAKVFTNSKDIVVGYQKRSTAEDDGSVTEIVVTTGRVTDNETQVDPSLVSEEAIGSPMQAIDQNS